MADIPLALIKINLIKRYVRQSPRNALARYVDECLDEVVGLLGKEEKPELKPVPAPAPVKKKAAAKREKPPAPMRVDVRTTE